MITWLWIVSLLGAFIINSEQCSAIAKQDGVKALYAFGDSYLDTGNADHVEGSLAWDEPYGISWPGYSNGRFGNGHILTDYIAEFFNLASPIPSNQVLENTTYNGINFAVGSSGVTYANGKPTLNVQVNSFQRYVKKGIVDKSNFENSVAFIGTGVNDYTSYKGENETIAAWLDIVVDGLAWNVFRLYRIGIRNIIISNLAPMSCFPQFTAAYNYTHCMSSTLTNQIEMLHNVKLMEAMRSLNAKVEGLHILLLDQTKAFQYLIDFAPTSGFEKPLDPCCKGTADNDVLKCSNVDEQGKPLYSVCANPEKAVFWDAWHPTEAACKAVVQLYTSEPGFTVFGDTLHTWAVERGLH